MPNSIDHDMLEDAVTSEFIEIFQAIGSPVDEFLSIEKSLTRSAAARPLLPPLRHVLNRIFEKSTLRVSVDAYATSIPLTLEPEDEFMWSPPTHVLRIKNDWIDDKTTKQIRAEFQKQFSGHWPLGSAVLAARTCVSPGQIRRFDFARREEFRVMSIDHGNSEVELIGCCGQPPYVHWHPLLLIEKDSKEIPEIPERRAYFDEHEAEIRRWFKHAPGAFECLICEDLEVFSSSERDAIEHYRSHKVIAANIDRAPVAVPHFMSPLTAFDLSGYIAVDAEVLIPSPLLLCRTCSGTGGIEAEVGDMRTCYRCGGKGQLPRSVIAGAP